MKKTIKFALNAIIAMLLISTAAYAATAFYKGERISGRHKICYYNHLGSEYAITIKSYQICPRTIKV
jgi:hypothetical protein